MGAPAENQKPPLQVVPAASAAAAAPQGPIPRKLKKGELLFAEGENSRAMYLIKTGMIRLYKKKGDASIELATAHAGQILGELAFLDGNPRSASGEALTDCDLIEISGPTFQQVLTRLPDWLKILLKTIVGRLRSASTHIRQLESSSTAFDYSNKDGKRSHYVYLSPHDCLKVCSALLLVGVRNSQKTEHGIDVRVGLLQRYGNQVMGVPVAKITSMLDILSNVGVIHFGTETLGGKVFLRDVDFLEEFIGYLSEENLLEPSKRHDISARGLAIMSAITKHLDKYEIDQKSGLTAVNVSEVKTLETGVDRKEPFRMEEFQELVKVGYASSLGVKSATEVTSYVKADTFAKATRFQKVILSIQSTNELKSKGGK